MKNRKNKRKDLEERQFIQSVGSNKTIVARGSNGEKKKKKNHKLRCLWIKVPYPVTEDCMCSCRKFDE